MRATLALSLLCVLWPGNITLAAPYDLQTALLGSPYPTSTRYSTEANSNFRSMALLVGATLTSSQVTAPKALGPMGFRAGFSRTSLDIPQTAALPTQAPFSGSLNVWTASVSKGLPLSFEVGSHVGWVENSNMYLASAEAKYVLTDLLHFGFRVHVDRLLNARDFNLTTVGSDLTVGKSFPLAGMMTLMPFGGWNLVWLSAQSTQVDFRPERTQAEAFSVANAQLADTGVFETVSFNNNNLNRFYAGLRMKASAVVLSAHWSAVLSSRFKSGERWVTPPSISGWNVTLGLDY